MRIGLTILIIIIIILLFSGFIYLSNKKPAELKIINYKNMIKITSTAFVQGGMIPQKYTCDGQNINPDISIEDVPESAKSLILIVDDPDSPRGIFTHWILYNIEPKTTKIQENSVPDGAINGINDFGTEKYGGPCPGSGIDRYFFTVMALDTILKIPNETGRKEIDKITGNHIIGQGQLMGKYEKK